MRIHSTQWIEQWDNFAMAHERYQVSWLSWWKSRQHFIRTIEIQKRPTDRKIGHCRKKILLKWWVTKIRSIHLHQFQTMLMTLKRAKVRTIFAESLKCNACWAISKILPEKNSSFRIYHSLCLDRSVYLIFHGCESCVCTENCRRFDESKQSIQYIKKEY